METTVSHAIAKRVLGWCLSFGLVVSVAACNDTPAEKCTPGESKACVGAGGCSGGQACLSDGTGFGPCDCAGGMDGGPGTDGGPLPDGGPDAGPIGDAGFPACNPVAQTGCKVGERCTWWITSDTTGQFTCFPEGTVPTGGPCTLADAGAMTSLDDCVHGSACVGGTCQLLCTESPDSCPAAYSCELYSGLFDTYGACVATCDPLTQVRSSDGADACGSVDPNAPSLGCYSNGRGGFICAKAGDPNKTSDAPAAVGGVVFLNACAPGFLPILTASSADPTTVICVALCAPGFTSSAQPANAAGISPHSCPDRGALAPHECHFFWLAQDPNGGLDQYSNTLGFCMNYTQYQFDADGDGVPETAYPSCTALSESTTTYDKSGTLPDNIYFGCGPHP